VKLSATLLDVSPLRTNAPFRRLWIGRTLSGLGGQLSLVAVMLQVWQETRSPVWSGAVGLAQALPLVLLGLYAGAVVDRVDRRRFSLLMTTGQLACSVLLALQGFLAPLSPAGLLVLVAVQSCFVAGNGPASRSFLPLLLPPHQLAAGLALSRIGFQGALLAGPALGGVVAGTLGVGACYTIDALTFTAALHAVFRLPRMAPGGTGARPGVRGVLDGLAFVARTPVIRGALLTDLAATLLAMPVSLFPLVNAEKFGGDPSTLGLFLTAVAVGGVAASLLSGTFTRLPRPGAVMVVSSAVWGVALALFGAVSDPWVALAFLVLAGAADTVSVVTRAAVVQSHTPTELLGRVAAAEQIVGQAGPDLGNLRAGLVADATSGTTALVSGGLLGLGAVIAVSVTTPELRRSPAVLPRSSPAHGVPPAPVAAKEAPAPQE
jgi:MFS family permease